MAPMLEGLARLIPAGKPAGADDGAGDGAGAGAGEASSDSSLSTLLETSSSEIAFDREIEELPRDDEEDNLPLLRTAYESSGTTNCRFEIEASFRLTMVKVRTN